MVAESAAAGETRCRPARRCHSGAGLFAILSALCLGVRRAAVALVVLCLTLAPLPPASAHDPLALSAAEAERHAALVAQEIAEHGHSHGDGEAHEQGTGHLHGHDPADHSHQVGFFAVSSSQWGLPASQRWPSELAELPDPAPGFGIDRPPKRSMSL